MNSVRLVIPLLFQSGEERRFFLEGAGLGAVRTVLAAGSASRLRATALVLTDDARGRVLAESYGLPWAEAHPPVTAAHDGILPPELEAARVWAMQNPAPGALLAASPRAPLLTTAMFDQAVAIAREETARPVLSVTSPKDHPVQFRRHLALLGAERTVFLEKMARGQDDGLARRLGLPDGLLRTRPFPVQAEPAPAQKAAEPEGGGSMGGGLFRLVATGCDAEFLPASPGDAAQGEPLWHFPGNGRAVLFFPPECLPHAGAQRPAAVTLPGPRPAAGAGDASPMRTRLVERGERAALLWPREFAPSGGQARIILLDGHGGVCAVHDVSPVEREDETFPMPGASVFGALCLYLREDPEGDFDLALPFLPDDSVWRVDAGSSATVNAATGRAICGRQDFMDVFTPDGALFCAPQKMLANLPQRLAEGRFQPLVLAPAQSLRVENAADMLLAAVRGLKEAAK